MSLAAGVVDSSTVQVPTKACMGLDNDEKSEVSWEKTVKTPEGEENVEEESSTGHGMSRKNSESSICPTEDEEDDEERKLDLGPRIALKEQLEKDKDDESLRRWKEQLLGAVDLESVGETLDPEVKVLSIAIISPGREDIVLLLPENGNPKGTWFTLKEGSHYSLKITFQWIAQKRCLEHSVLKLSLTHMRCLKKQPHLGFLLEDLMQLESSLLMMTRSATWRSITPSKSVKIGVNESKTSNFSFVSWVCSESIHFQLEAFLPIPT
ncbi:rho GDP-dissociation inhibitor 1 isoform X1 [Carica papaya]|uniref:rho GDP-dissociation inhibitor 1 isoform X1 n=1 Tax=Carica papaya TaxID=3649 RepID=UPI000B8CC341|nr:rho GDP-dissociation inhibitor 1 isoform X1 [Carica papaya]